MTKCCEPAAGARGGAAGEVARTSARPSTTSPSSGRRRRRRPWRLQFGGHHLAINLTLAGSQATMAPSLPAAQPATYTFEGREIRPLGKENDKAFALIGALDEKQRGQAIIGARVADLVLGAGQDGKVIQPEGLRASAMSAAQQDMLLEIVREWAGHHERRVRRAAPGRNPRQPGADLLRLERADHATAARRISACRDRRWSSSTRRRAASTTSTPSTAIRPTTTVRSSRRSRQSLIPYP